MRKIFCYILCFRCSNCNDVFIGRYNLNGNSFDLVYLYPKNTPLSKSFKEINTISPQFVEIYSQAEFAELNGLSSLTGIGYRKSLEYLIKDYLIKIEYKNENEIKSKPLGECINLLENPKLKKAAKGATWIGNDETHYERRNQGYNINHLKEFIKVTTFYIECEMIYKNIEKLVN